VTRNTLNSLTYSNEEIQQYSSGRTQPSPPLPTLATDEKWRGQKGKKVGPQNVGDKLVAMDCSDFQCSGMHIWEEYMLAGSVCCQQANKNHRSKLQKTDNPTDTQQHKRPMGLQAVLCF